MEAEEIRQGTKEGQVVRVPLHFTEEELSALNNFFNGTGEMADEIYDPLARKIRIAAAKMGLWDEVYGRDL